MVVVDDTEAALTFYRDGLGLTVLFDGEADGHRPLHAGLSDGAGLWLMPEESPEARAAAGRQTGGLPLPALHTADLDRVEARLAELGVSTPPGVPDGGPDRSPHFRDLSGNELVAARLA
ncbi:VOC family protein [Streptomyces sp. BE20]|uniref:VOC family protein n=1 Tax=Streptomyces sp. BE20 TaxID=3002525 RepID=UPI002E77EE16|nr:VOC family protein [Streptomyces sp. BE20]MEE1824959.1 VOC family protein [Streptomyces sp. BE20]